MLGLGAVDVPGEQTTVIRGWHVTMTQPNPLRVAWSVLRARRVRPPAPRASEPVDEPDRHEDLATILETLAAAGTPALVDLRSRLDRYRDRLAGVDPDDLDRPSALAYWIDLYNAGALRLAGDALAAGRTTVLRVPGAFDDPWVEVAGEALSLNDVEHGKIRRFGDPRIHGALVCGSVSCPTLRYEPFVGDRIDRQLDDQMRSFLAAGGASYGPAEGTLTLSRVFLWYGGDFTRPSRMPTWLPARASNLAAAVSRWLADDVARAIEASDPKVRFASYDWGLACSLAARPPSPPSS